MSLVLPSNAPETGQQLADCIPTAKRLKMRRSMVTSPIIGCTNNMVELHLPRDQLFLVVISMWLCSWGSPGALCCVFWLLMNQRDSFIRAWAAGEWLDESAGEPSIGTAWYCSYSWLMVIWLLPWAKQWAVSIVPLEKAAKELLWAADKHRTPKLL